MKRIVYDKLVRDRIPEIIQADGRMPVVRIATPGEHRALLQQKLAEELGELSASGSNRSDELADLLEVLHALAALEGLSPSQLEAIRAEKAAARGAFTQGIVLEHIEEP